MKFKRLQLICIININLYALVELYSKRLHLVQTITNECLLINFRQNKCLYQTVQSYLVVNVMLIKRNILYSNISIKLKYWLQLVFK